ncbi:MAG: deoxyguanosinetriphosphate triphosphohydrolase [Stackebrandtia sp.]
MTDAERYAREEPKPGRQRSPFERDRARVLHSAGFRRLAAKTQVHTAGSGEFLRTRLTHSLEVAQIAREMGAWLGCDPDVTDVAGLAHDLGHPPFGHNGEKALGAVAEACGGFEGNAQTLRVLTRLEAKVFSSDGRSAGLNLTRAALDATCKYPWERVADNPKFGVYADDREIFDWARRDAPDAKRLCLEAQVMDWADDVAYSVHDVEDGIYSGYVDCRKLVEDRDEQEALCRDAAANYSPEPVDALREELAELLGDPVVEVLAGYDGSHEAQAALKRFTSAMTGRFVTAAVTATQRRHGGSRLRRYDADLIVPQGARMQCALLKGMAWRYVMRPRAAEPWYTRQREILAELVSALTLRAPDALDHAFAPLWEGAVDDAARLRVVVDQVASLTDLSAVDWHARLC